MFIIKTSLEEFLITHQLNKWMFKNILIFFFFKCDVISTLWAQIGTPHSAAEMGDESAAPGHFISIDFTVEGWLGRGRSDLLL